MFILLYTWGCLEISTVPNYFLLMKNFDMKILSVDFFFINFTHEKKFLTTFQGPSGRVAVYSNASKTSG